MKAIVAVGWKRVLRRNERVSNNNKIERIRTAKK
jgi:hypothetical protein